MKKLTLELEEEDYDYALIGIVSHERDYRLCWLINKDLGFNFIRNDSIGIIPPKKKTEITFPIYHYCVQKDVLDYYLISNKNKSQRLIPEFNHADFLIMIKGPFLDQEKKDLIKNLKSIKNILLSFDIDLEKISEKNKNNLIL